MTVSINKPATLRDQVVDILTHELRGGLFAPGEQITEQGLAVRLDVSRTPIRDALSRLTELGLLQAHPRLGYIVPSPTTDHIRQIIAVRMLLEPPAIRLAAIEYGAEEVGRITKAIYNEAVAACNPRHTDFTHANETFRRAVFDGISNQVLGALIAQLANHLTFIRAATLQNMRLRLDLIKREREVCDAIASHDEDLAECLWRSYLKLMEEALLSATEKIV